MSILAHNNKIIITPNKKSLTFDNLIALANATTGANDKTLTSAMNSLISKYVFHTTGTVDYYGSNRTSVSVPYSRPERNVLFVSRITGVWYKNENSEWVLSNDLDFRLANLTTTSSHYGVLNIVAISPNLTLAGFNFTTQANKTLWARQNNGGVLYSNPVIGASNPGTYGMLGSAGMTFSGTTLSVPTNADYFSTSEYGTRSTYHIYAWGDAT